MKVTVSSLPELRAFARKYSKTLKGGETLALVGELGAGKTAFTRALLKSVGIKKRVTSPTFVLMLPYKKSHKSFYHVDLYRIKDFKELRTLGIEQLWQDNKNIFLIEWADKIKKYLPKKTITLKFKVLANNKREINIS